MSFSVPIDPEVRGDARVVAMLDSSLADGILTLRLSRNPANALDSGLIAALDAEVRAAPKKGAEAIVITGRPNIFSGGLDVPHLLGLGTEQLRAALGSYFSLCANLARSEIPTCAAISGHSPAGGAVLTLHMDYRIMAEGDYVIGLNETQVGLAIPESIYNAMVFVVGTRAAERLVVPGLLISAKEALRVGLVDELVPLAELEARATAWCRSLLALPREAMLANRAQCRKPLTNAAESLQRASVDVFVEYWQRPSTQAALEALAKKLGK